MITFVSKYWKIILIGIMTITLGVAIYMVTKLSNTINDNKIAIDLLNKRIDANNKIYEKNQEIIHNLEKNYADQKVIVVTTKEFYERIKKSPINTNISDTQLLNKLKELESKYPKK